MVYPLEIFPFLYEIRESSLHVSLRNEWFWILNCHLQRDFNLPVIPKSLVEAQMYFFHFDTRLVRKAGSTVRDILINRAVNKALFGELFRHDIWNVHHTGGHLPPFLLETEMKIQPRIPVKLSNFRGNFYFTEN